MAETEKPTVRAEPDLSRFQAAVQLRDRCVRAALADYARVGLSPIDAYARSAYDSMAELIREDERRRAQEVSSGA